MSIFIRAIYTICFKICYKIRLGAMNRWMEKEVWLIYVYTHMHYASIMNDPMTFA